MPVLDAVIPAFEPDVRALERAVASAWACVGEGGGGVVVVDDGSAVPVTIDADHAEGNGSRSVQVVRQANAGPSAARNAGLARTQARWVLLLDADDEAVPEGVRAMIALGDALKASCVLGARVHVFADGRESLRPVPPEWAGGVGMGGALPAPGDVFRPIGLFGASASLISSRVIAGGVRFDPALKIGEDRDFIRTCAAVGPIGICPAVVLRCTMHEDGGNLSSARHIDRRIRDHVRICERWCDEQSHEHFAAATRWLINAAAKSRASEGAWRELLALASSRGFAVPIKARVRRVWGAVQGLRAGGER